MAGNKAKSRRSGTSSPPVTPAREANLLRRAMAIAHMGYWQSDSIDSRTFWISPELSEMYGLAAEDGIIAIADIRARYLGSAPQELFRHYCQCWEDGQPYAVRGQYHHPDGRIIDYSVHGEAERDDAGRIVRVSGIVRDVTDEVAAIRSSTASEKQLADFLDTASDWCWETDTEHRFCQLERGSEWAKSMLGVPGFGLTRWDLPLVPEDLGRMREHQADLDAHRPFRAFDYSIVTNDGTIRTLRSSGKPVFDASGAFIGYRGTASDITALRQAEQLLLQRTAALAEAHRLGRMGSWFYRLGDERVIWSEELFALAGYDPATFDMSHANVLAHFEPDDAVRLVEMQRQVLKTGGTATADLQFRCADGRLSDFIVNCKAELRDGKVIGLVGTVQDITERKQVQRQLEHLAFTDPLTGLANRALFKRSLSETIGRSLLEDRFAALLLIDLDHFKEVNDSLGHAAGDELLCRVAAVLRREVGPSAFIARLGGDEFAVVLERSSVGENLVGLAEHLVAAITGPVDLANGEAFVSATIGIANLPEDGTSTEQAMRNADLALYMAKEAGRGRSMIFEPAYAQAVEQRHDLARHLRHAVQENALQAHYQPQVDLTSGKVVGFESLLRWNHPERGPVSPSEFIPVAESSGLIVDLGLWILRESCRQGRAWLDAGFPARSISVNVSPAQFWNMDFETAVSAVLAETGFPPSLLCLELTEGLFVDQSEHRISRTLSALAALGVRLALDDFGSGYSSLGYLTRLPFDRLKVDRSFVDGIATQPDKRKLLGGIIALSRGLGMTVIAEGAERPAEVDVLAELGCDIVQGYVYSRPVVPDVAPVVAASIERETQRRNTIRSLMDERAVFAAAPVGV
jgi:diguanylate cyclase (GGDEF)-like protein/PAS domain S-box-containing protein